MKTLLILRHAKAQPDAPHGDRARELTKRGHRDAAAIGNHLGATIGRPDLIVTSDARRARQTAEAVATATGFVAPLTITPDAYGADLANLLAIVRGLPGGAERVLLVGHNPGLEELTEALAATAAPGVHLPTAGLAHLEFDVDRWTDLREGTGRLRDLATPKTIAG